MGPHDLLCKWCSTFVGKDKQFCSIFCESRHTRSKRRKLAYKRPVKSSGSEGHYTEYVSPRATKTAPSKKQFLEDVLTAMTMDEHKPRNKGRTEESGNDDAMSKDSSQTSGSGVATPRKSAIPRLDMSKLKDKNEKDENSDKRVKSTTKPEYKLKSKTHTILVHSKKDSSTLSRKAVISSAKSGVVSKSVDFEGLNDKQTRDESASKTTKHTAGILGETSGAKSGGTTDNKSKTATKTSSQSVIQTIGSKKERTNLDSNQKKTSMPDDKTKRQTASQFDKNDSDKTLKSEQTGIPEEIEPLPRQNSKVASELAHRVRSSGYGAPVNLRLRPVALKPRSANMLPSKLKRESSAGSTKSLKLGVNREKSRPIMSEKGQSKWELVQKPITEEPPSGRETNSTKEDTDRSLEHEDPSPTSSSRTTTTKTKQDKFDNSKRELQSIDELLREETTGSILDPSILQQRLSSIKKKVEVRRRGRDSRSSVSSELDSTFDTSFDASTSRDKLNSSHGGTSTSTTSTARASARTNITRISKQFRSTKVN